MIQYISLIKPVLVGESIDFDLDVMYKLFKKEVIFNLYIARFL